MGEDLNESGAWNLRRVRIFLADDDPSLRRLLAAVLRADGYEVIEAEDGADLLQLLATTLVHEAPLEPPDVDMILTDVRMPGTGGLEILRGLREASWTTPIILMTGHADRSLRHRARALGATALLEKPIDLAGLRAAVNRVASRD